ncbi:MAG TPA: autotransporter assembly complex family protein [Reyranella sp.]|nr:autotransporter assembly complex family protein [Reyranella sp.]
MQRRTGPFWLGRLLIVTAATLLLSDAADARTAGITLKVIGDQRMADELKKLSEDLDKDEPLSGDSVSLLQAVQARRARVASALRSRGFYDARVRAVVANQPVGDPAALDAIDSRPESEKINFDMDVATGPVYRVADVDIEGPSNVVGYPPLDLSKLALRQGAPADASDILAAEKQILEIVRGEGYALAAISHRDIVVDHATREAHVTFVVRPGPVATMGPVHFSGTQKIDTDYLQKRVPFQPGEPYRPEKVDALRDRLMGLGVFSAVRITPADQLSPNGELPIDVELHDRLPRTIGFGVTYETQLGAGVNAYWMHRNLFGEAESLKLSAAVNNIFNGSSAFGDFGYAFKADFRKPDWWLSGQDATADAAAVDQIFPAYRRKAVTVGVGLDRVLSRHWEVKVGISTEWSQITRFGILNYYNLYGLPMQVLLNEADSLVDATHGYRITFDLTPYVDAINNNDIFAIARLTGTSYINVSGDGRSVIAARASLGTIPGGTNAAIPFDKLFYAGGGGSVRGFAYQSAGPRDAFNNPLGGASLVEANLEFRQRIGKSFGAVAFIDSGSAYSETFPNFGDLSPRLGAGAGVRYYTSFGPARLDVGVPLNPRPGDAPFGVYVSLGQAF